MQYSYLNLEVLEAGPATAAAAQDSPGLPHTVAQALHHPHIRSLLTIYWSAETWLI